VSGRHAINTPMHKSVSDPDDVAALHSHVTADGESLDSIHVVRNKNFETKQGQSLKRVVRNMRVSLRTYVRDHGHHTSVTLQSLLIIHTIVVLTSLWGLLIDVHEYYCCWCGALVGPGVSPYLSATLPFLASTSTTTRYASLLLRPAHPNRHET
jgi:hypothetical protein